MRYKTILLLVLSAWGIMACQNYTDKIAVEIRQPVYPVLTLKEHNPVLCLRLIRNSEAETTSPERTVPSKVKFIFSN